VNSYWMPSNLCGFHPYYFAVVLSSDPSEDKDPIGF
jgi:hypothetical protein